MIVDVQITTSPGTDCTHSNFMELEKLPCPEEPPTKLKATHKLCFGLDGINLGARSEMLPTPEEIEAMGQYFDFGTYYPDISAEPVEATKDAKLEETKI
jgi:hypothetical protein